MEKTLQTISEALKSNSILSSSTIGVNFGPNFNRDTIILFSLVSTGSVLMLLLKRLRQRQIQNLEANPEKFKRVALYGIIDSIKQSTKDNHVTWKGFKNFILTESDKNRSRYPGSKSILVFLYLSSLIISQEIFPSYATWGPTLGWMIPFSAVSAFVIIIVMFFESFITKVLG